MALGNRQIILMARPNGMPSESDFAIVEQPMPVPGPGEFLVRAHYLSVDALQRLRMNESSTYGQTIPLGTVVWGRQVGTIAASKHPDFMLATSSRACSAGKNTRS